MTVPGIPPRNRLGMPLGITPSIPSGYSRGFLKKETIRINLI